MKKILLYTLILATTTLTSLAVDIKGDGFSPNTIRPGETAKYTIILDGLRGSIDPSIIPMPQGLRIVGKSSSQRMSIVNGKMSSQTELVYSVYAQDEGDFTVPEWTIEHDNKKYRIPSAKLSVSKTAPQQAQHQSNSFFDDEDEDPFGFPSIFQRMRNMQQSRLQRAQQAYQRQQQSLGKLSDHISLKLELPKGKIYVGEAIPCKLVFSCSKELVNNGFKLARMIPQVNKSDAFDCILLDDKSATKTDKDGEKITIFDILVTPLKAGSYNLDFNANGIFLQEMNVDPFFMSFGGANQIPFEISTEDKKITVSELPSENKPANFSGAIGKFSISQAKVEPNSISVGEPCVVTIELVGMGNFPRINAPQMINSNDWKTYGAKTSFTDESNGKQYVGIKNFRYTIVPKKPDLTKTPDIVFSYFDSEKNEYKTLTVDGASISVAPSGAPKPKEEPKPTVADKKIEPNFEKIIETKQVAGHSNLFESPQFWIIQIVILAAVASFIFYKTRKLKLENDPVYAHRVKSLKKATYHLKLAKDAAGKNDTTTFLENARKTIQNALAATVPDLIESEAILLRQAKEIMLENGFTPDEIETVSTFFAGVDAINYGGLDKTSVDIQSLMSKLQKIHSQLK